MQPPLPNDDIAALRSQGISALKAGDMARARELLAQAIQRNPRDELSWLWLSGAVETDYDRQRCLERVLLLNPQNQAARQGLAQLAAPGAALAPASAPPVSIQSAPPSEPARVPELREQILTPLPPPIEPVAAEARERILTPLPPPIEPAVAGKGLASAASVAPASEATPGAIDPLAGLRPTAQLRRLSPMMLALIGLVCLVVILGAVVVMRRLGESPKAALPTTAPVVDAATSPPISTPRPKPTRVPPTPTATVTPPPTPTAVVLPTTLPTSTVPNAAVLVTQAVAKTEQKDYKGAIADLTQAIKLDPNSADAYYQRGFARKESGQVAAAIKDFASALHLDPDYPLSYINRAAVYKVQGNRKLARADYQKALELYQQRDDTKNAEQVSAWLKELDA